MLVKEQLDPERYTNVIALKKALGGRTLSDINSLAKAVQDPSVQHGYLISFGLESSFYHIGQLVRTDKWGWVKELTFPGMISSLLIAGYGEMLQRSLGIDGLYQIFYRAFEEVLINYPDFELLQDVLSAMIDEIRDFSPEARKLIVAAASTEETTN